jgi:nucleotide-binding universal stress UspA family protein
MFKKILFATTATPACDNAAKAAFVLSRKYNASLHIFHVFGVPHHGYSPFVRDIKTGVEESMYDPDVSAWAREEIRIRYAEDIERYPRCDIDCNVGVPYREILRKARQENVDAIIMGSHTSLPSNTAARYRNVVGNTMQHVAKFAKCPVFVISRPCKTCVSESATLVLSTDFSRASHAAFQFAAAMARQIRSRLLIFHSVDITPRHFVHLDDQDTIERNIESARRRIETEYLSDLDGSVKAEVHVREGIPHVELLKFAREQEANLIVMAHHNSDLPDEDGFLGSMVEQVVLRSSCPVVSVNRPGPSREKGLWEMDEAVIHAR